MAQVTHKTVDPQTLPSYQEARDAAHKVWEVINAELRESGVKEIWHDYWENSTPTTGIREIRLRFVYVDVTYDESDFSKPIYDDTNADLICNVVKHQGNLLAQEMPEGTTKVYKYASWVGQWIAIKQYYRSWKPGEPRNYASPDEGFALTFHKGDRIEYRLNDGTWVKATVLERGTSLSYRPHYKIRTDEPYHQPYGGMAIEDLPEHQRAWYYETYALQPWVREAQNGES